MLAMFIKFSDMLVSEFLVLPCVIFEGTVVKATLSERLGVYFDQLCMGEKAANFRMSECQGSGGLRAILIQPCSFDLWRKIHLEMVEEIYVRLYKNISVTKGICFSWLSSPGFSHSLPRTSKWIQLLTCSENEPGILSLRRQPSSLRLKKRSVVRIIRGVLLKSISDLMILSC